MLLIAAVMAPARHDRRLPPFAGDLGQITPISPKTRRITQGAPEKIRVKPFGIMK
jgi:hypothetical protein